jgi:hypothetical protein
MLVDLHERILVWTWTMDIYLISSGFCPPYTYTAKSQYRKFETNVPRKGIARPQSQFPHSCLCERFLYSHDWSAYYAARNMWNDPGNIQSPCIDTVFPEKVSLYPCIKRILERKLMRERERKEELHCNKDLKELTWNFITSGGSFRRTL